ncbi:MAG: sodium:proton antiporter [Acetobacteraceae bacterium]|nr:sodium:proton antiporter [Pseudomonadota bacterium]
MIVSTADLIAIMLLIAVAVIVINDRTLCLPRPVALLLGAMLVAGAIIVSDTLISQAELRERLRSRMLGSVWPEILLNALLALLLFASALGVDLHMLRNRAWTVLALATAGVILAAGLFAIGIWLVLQAIGAPVPLGWCLVIGAILAPTDAVAVEGLLSKVHLPPRLHAVISGESLFNDGAAVVLFTAALAIANGDTEMLGRGHLLEAILFEGVGGAILGVVAGYLTCRAVRLTAETNVALMISLALVLCTYRGAIALGFSGPIAVVAAGLMFSYKLNELSGADAVRFRANLSTLWSLVDELLNTMLYVVIGFVVLALEPSWIALAVVLAAVPMALLCRLISVGLPVLLLNLRVPHVGRSICVLTWAGLRGGISIALALSVPPSPYRDLLLAICFCVVIFTTVVQGLTLPRLITALYHEDHAGDAAPTDTKRH